VHASLFVRGPKTSITNGSEERFGLIWIEFYEVRRGRKKKSFIGDRAWLIGEVNAHGFGTSVLDLSLQKTKSSGFEKVFFFFFPPPLIRSLIGGCLVCIVYERRPGGLPVRKGEGYRSMP